MVEQTNHEIARREFFGRCGIGLGSLALASLLRGDARGATSAEVTRRNNPLAVLPTHRPAKVKRVIQLFMAGGPSQLELFDFKPKLQQLSGEVVPASLIENKRFAFLKENPKLLGTRRKFARVGQCGAEISECLPHLAEIVDDISIVRSMATDVFNHGPAKAFLNTGSARFGRPSIGAWVTYGIGSESDNMPGFVVLQSGPRGPRGGTALYSNGFLPSVYQGVPFRSSGEPILNLSRPAAVTASQQQEAVEAIVDMNRLRLAEVGDPEIATRIAAYEMAARMQTSAPELIDLADESAETLALYGVEAEKPSFAKNCLLARRLVERGVRYVMLFHTDWDHHGGPNADLDIPLEQVCRETDQASTALVKDLKRRGLLDDTLVVWGGEFGRTPMGEDRDTIGRDHHIECYATWLAGGGIRPGQTIGATDEFGFFPVEDRVHVHDLQATILGQLGLDHERLTYRFQGRDFRLTDVAGKVVDKLLV
jgi:uncharacterized protein (DUF1501 family)